MKHKRAFGELESTILQLVKKKKKATVSDIYILLKKEVAYTTIMTVMDRLFKKSYLQRHKEKRSYIYSLSPNSTSYFFAMFHRLKQKIFGGSTIEMVSYLLKDSNNVSLKELETINQLIQKAKKKKQNE